MKKMGWVKMTLDCETRVPIWRSGFDPRCVTCSKFDSYLKMFVQEGSESKVI